MDKTIQGIVKALLCPEHKEDSDHFIVIQTGEILYQKIMAMPLFLKTAMTVLLWVFNGYGFIIGGTSFDQLDLAANGKRARLVLAEKR